MPKKEEKKKHRAQVRAPGAPSCYLTWVYRPPPRRRKVATAAAAALFLWRFQRGSKLIGVPLYSHERAIIATAHRALISQALSLAFGYYLHLHFFVVTVFETKNRWNYTFKIRHRERTTIDWSLVSIREIKNQKNVYELQSEGQARGGLVRGNGRGSVYNTARASRMPDYRACVTQRSAHL